MDIQAYIDSGNLELYVLGRLDPSAEREVEQYARDYPEIRAEITAVERALENYALAHGTATPPRPELLQPLLDAIGPDGPPPPAGSTPPPPTGGNTLRWFPWLLAALAGVATLYLASVNGRTATELANLQENYTTLVNDCDDTEDALRAAEERLRILSSAGTRDVILAGTEIAPQVNALVFYSPTTAQAFFRATSLPAPPAGFQYQLWAIDDGGPKDLGVLDPALGDDELLEVRYLPNVATFAITLEVAGGQPTPDLSQLQAIGNV